MGEMKKMLENMHFYVTREFDCPLNELMVGDVVSFDEDYPFTVCYVCEEYIKMFSNKNILLVKYQDFTSSENCNPLKSFKQVILLSHSWMSEIFLSALSIPTTNELYLYCKANPYFNMDVHAYDGTTGYWVKDKNGNHILITNDDIITDIDDEEKMGGIRPILTLPRISQ